MFYSKQNSYLYSFCLLSITFSACTTEYPTDISASANQIEKKDLKNNHSHISDLIKDNEVLQQARSVIVSANGLTNLGQQHLKFPIKKTLRKNVSQQFLGSNEIEQRLIEVLPEVEYSTEGLSEFETSVNQSNWIASHKLDFAMVVKIQALLNWNNHSVGAIDGKFSTNTLKALQTFQKSKGIEISKRMNDITWGLLNSNSDISSQPVLVKYKLTKKDVTIPRQWGNKKNMQYKTVRELLAEKFHMSQGLLKRLNKDTRLKEGKTITIYNPGQPNQEPVVRMEVYKRKNLLIAFNYQDQIIASYPTTIGINSPNGSYYVANRVYQPTYNSDFSNKDTVLPPGPNSPVGLVWMGLSKRSFGIHGSAHPEMISRQRSHGCVRLTNWDALSLYGTIEKKAKIQFKNI